MVYADPMGNPGAGLARMAFPEENLAAWPVVFSILLFFRSFGMALPEVVIALLKKAENLAPLRHFCLLVAAGSSGALAMVTFSPLLLMSTSVYQKESSAPGARSAAGMK